MNTEQIDTFKKLVGELVISMDRIAAERDQVKAILEKVKTDCEVDKSHARKVAKAIHDNKVAEVLSQSEELTDLIEIVRE